MTNLSFDLKTPEHLYEKLSRELERLDAAVREESQLRAIDHALNFAITAWSMCDWLFAAGRAVSVATEKGGFKAWVKDQSEDMQLCADLANGAKHFTLRRESDINDTKASKEYEHNTSVVQDVVQPVVKPVVRPVFAGGGQYRLILSVETESLGIVDVRQLFENVLSYWKDTLNRLPTR